MIRRCRTFAFAALAAMVSFNLRAEAVEIGSAADFAEKIAANPAGEFKLTANIDLTDAGWVTIDFSGVLDGNGKTVSGVGAQALFGTMSGTIKNLVLDGLVDGNQTVWSYSGSDDGHCQGALCLSNYCGQVIDTTVRGYKIYATYSTNNKITHYLGAFAARALGSAVFEDCVSTNNALGGDRIGKVGGICGAAAELDNITEGPRIADCVNYSKLYAQTYSNGEHLGGIVGRLNGSKGHLSIVTNCVNYGSFSSDYKDVIAGGICGSANADSQTDHTSVQIINCANYGSMAMDKGTHGGCWAAGLIGEVAENGAGFIVSNCVNYGNLTVNISGHVSGLVGHHANLHKSGATKFFNCANYGTLTAHGTGRACGFCGELTWHPDYQSTHLFYNCANYGDLVVDETASKYEMLSGVLNRKSGTADGSEKIIFDNCLFKTASLTNSTTAVKFTVRNCLTAEDDGYDPLSATKSLTAWAKTNGYEPWTQGKVGDKVYPELGIFCEKPYVDGFMLLVR